jgi:heme exporter protein D
MPDLGEYAVSVLSAYGFSLAVLIVVVWFSARAARAARAALDRQERGDDG